MSNREKERIMSNSFKDDIIDYWQERQDAHLNDLLIRYDNLEVTHKLPDQMIRQFEQFCESSFSTTGADKAIEGIISVCINLPTPLLMYFMQNLHRKNYTVFQTLYQRIASHPSYLDLLERCMSFEKNLILTRVLDTSRIEAIDKAIICLAER